MTNATCPHCNQPVLLASLKNERNGRWTVLPLDEAFHPSMPADFDVLDEVHEAVDILGNSVGPFPVAIYLSDLDPSNNYKTHPPSHYLGGH